MTEDGKKLKERLDKCMFCELDSHVHIGLGSDSNLELCDEHFERLFYLLTGVHRNRIGVR